MRGSWAQLADDVLATLYRVGEPTPTRRALADAYPFGEREYWPYKAWLRRARAWRAEHAAGMARPFDAPRARVHDRDTLPLFGEADTVTRVRPRSSRPRTAPPSDPALDAR